MHSGFRHISFYIHFLTITNGIWLRAEADISTCTCTTKIGKRHIYTEYWIYKVSNGG